ncbi:ketopantoate reductase family protein [Marinobacter sp. SS13-12]|uniref:ketopantoate reductase family protein n=1 Tax=Marinobacter sp. SS13-12 TaxID=3050451 RepID=UPI0025558931|nr:ketopantoate reductase family protein [Marinobacter sp. SS13-12]MDK8465700.1 ketopantoate reductase family protein [Marinobacter sp. SS13-12]
MAQHDRQFGIVGAGGIGSFYAMKLLNAGHRCVMVARGKRLGQLLESGLRLSHDTQYHEVPCPSACDLSQLFEHYTPGQFHALALCTKSSATKELAGAIAGWFARCNATCPVISLQNGMDNESTLAGALPRNCVFGGLAVKIGAHLTADGSVEAKGPGELIIGPWPKGSPDRVPAEVSTAFEQSGAPIRISNNIQRELWLKLAINNGVNPLSALTGLDTRSLSREPPFAPMVYSLMQEVAIAASADEVLLTRQDIDDMYYLIRSFDAIKTSMLVDHEQGRALELDAICGAVMSRHQRLGIDAPYTRLVYALLSQMPGSVQH